MKIVVEFNSLEEMNEFCNGVAVAPGLLKKTEAVQESKAVKEKREAKTVKKESPKEEPAEQEEAPAEEAAAQEAVSYTLEDVRKKLGALQKAGHREEVKKLLQSMGAEKLPEVDPKDYALLMQKAGELDA